MLAEWLLIALLLGTMLFFVWKHCRTPRLLLWILAGVFATTAGVVIWQGHLQRNAQSLNSLQSQIPQQGLPEYAGSDVCRSCHSSQFDSWHRSYHRTMTQLATPAAVKANFNNVSLEWRGEQFFLERRGDEFWVDMIDPDWRYIRAMEEYKYKTGKTSIAPTAEPNPPRVKKRICMLTGSHHMQAFWVPGKYGNQQFNFPFSYLLEDQRWAPRDDIFLKDPQSDKSFQTWNLNCFACHSTAGEPRQDPESYLLATRTAEFGISCEACHGLAAKHVRENSSPARRYALHHRGEGDDTIVNPGRLSTRKASEVCGQCHATRQNIRKDWFQKGSRYRPGADGILETDAPLIRPEKNIHRTETLLVTSNSHSILQGSFWGDGMIRVSGREYNGLVYSPCYIKGELSCLSCHSMHSNLSSDDQLSRGMDGNHACVQCHQRFKKDLSAHTHHSSGSTGSLCYNCHMPHTTYGLLKAIRSHQISSPSVLNNVQTGRPNACNLCHLDKSLDWTANQLSAWFKTPKPPLSEEDRTISAAATWALRGDAGQRAIVAWHMGWEPAKAVSGTNWQAPYLAQLLDDPYAAVRYVAQRSLKRLPGFGSFTYDFVSQPEQRADARVRAFDTWKTTAPGESMKPVLVQPNGTIDQPAFQRLLNQRDDHSMDLLE